MRRMLLRLGVLAVALAAVTLGDAHPAAAVPLPPTPVLPHNGTRLDTYEVFLEWSYPNAPITQVRLQVLPANGDGAGIDVILDARCCANQVFRIPPPPEWYGLLPDMTYSWRLQASEATTPITIEDTSWGPWSQTFTFQTPRATTRDVLHLTPPNGATTITTPTMTWRSGDPRVFYFEFQLSSDPTFNTDPATATAPVYWNLIHGGLTSPPNSYTVPPQAALERGKTYYWRVRPRIQGDGTPLPWTEPWHIRVP